MMHTVRLVFAILWLGVAIAWLVGGWMWFDTARLRHQNGKAVWSASGMALLSLVMGVFSILMAISNFRLA